MAKSLSMAQLKQLAAHGARARLAELHAEIAAITQAFPQVAGAAVKAVTGRRRRALRRSDASEAASATPRARRKISAAGRAAIAAAQKKRWAAIKKQKAASAS